MFCSGNASESINLSCHNLALTLVPSRGFSANPRLEDFALPYINFWSPPRPDILWGFVFSLKYITGLPVWLRVKTSGQLKYLSAFLEHSHVPLTSSLPAVPKNFMQWTVSECYSLVALEKLFEKFGFRCRIFLMWVAHFERKVADVLTLAYKWQLLNQTSAFLLELSPNATMLESPSKSCWSQISPCLVCCWKRRQLPSGLLFSEGSRWPREERSCGSRTPSSTHLEHPHSVGQGQHCFPCTETQSWHRSWPVQIPQC